MSRGDGFAVADIDSSYLDDAKLRALWQRLQDTDRMARAVILHQSTVLASWRHGERVTAMEAAPLWLPADAELVAHLIAVRLLDKNGRLRPESWREWFGAAVERRDKARERGRRGGLAKAANRSSASTAQAEHKSTHALPDRTVPTVPTESPLTPHSGATPRARGTNPRAIAELQAAKARREAKQAQQLKVAHNNGLHADESDPRCGYCRERSAAYA